MKTQLHPTQWQRLRKEAIRPWQDRRLKHYLRHVVLPYSPYYRELFRRLGLSPDDIRSVADLRKLPFTTKKDLLSSAEHPDKIRQFVLTPDREQLARRPSILLRGLLQGRARVREQLESEFRPIFMTSTTGRSTDAVPFLFTGHDLANLTLTGRRLFEICGAERQFRMINLFPYAPHLAFWQVHYGGVAFGTLVVSTGGGKTMGTEGQIRLMQKLKPEVLIGMPTFIYHVLTHAVEEGVSSPQLRRIVLGGEKAPDGLRRKLVQLTRQLGAEETDIVVTYGFTEAKMAWAECPVPPGQSPSGYHLYPDLGIIEIVDPETGEPVPEGNPGEIVFTPLAARGSVVLRYRTGDYIDGGVTYEPCPFCGRTTPRLFGRISRRSDIQTMQLDKIKGTLVDLNQLEHVLDNVERIGAWQIELRKRNDDPWELDELILHVHVPDGVSQTQLSSELNHRFATEFEVTLNRIEFHDAGELRRLQGVGSVLKEKKIVDHRPQMNQPGPAAAVSDTDRTTAMAGTQANAGTVEAQS